MQQRTRLRKWKGKNSLKHGDRMAHGFVMLPSYYEALRPLSGEDRLSLYDAIMDYAFALKEPDGLTPIQNAIFCLLRPNIDSSIKHYSASVVLRHRRGQSLV